MEKKLDITKPRYSVPILPVPRHFVILRGSTVIKFKESEIKNLIWILTKNVSSDGLTYNLNLVSKPFCARATSDYSQRKLRILDRASGLIG